MKRILLSFIIILLLLTFSAASYASDCVLFDDISFAESDGFETKITDIHGNEYVFSGAVDVQSLSDSEDYFLIRSYSVLCANQTVITAVIHEPDESAQNSSGTLLLAAEPVQTKNGYYSVEFNTDSTHLAYITGLSENNVSLIQSEIISSIANKTNFDVTHVDFIDTEKILSYVNDESETRTDSYLCWAAADANILSYTGWAKKAGFNTADDMFEYFIDTFDNEGSNCTFTLKWFFNGYYEIYGNSIYSSWSMPDGYRTTGGFFKDYCADDLIETYYMQCAGDDINDVFNALRNECGVCGAVNWLKNGESEGGHAISVWGYVLDLSKDINDKNRYCGLIISDSDSDINTQYKDRRNAPNRLTYMKMTPYETAYYNTWELDYVSGYNAVLSDFTVLKPYSDTLEKDQNGTHDIFNYPDISIYSIGIANKTQADTSSQFLYSTSDELRIFPTFYNNSGANVETGQNIYYSITVSKDDKVVTSGSFTAECTSGLGIRWYTDQAEVSPFAIGKLNEGEYIVTVFIVSTEFEEAYCNNNITSKMLIVKDCKPDFKVNSYTSGLFSSTRNVLYTISGIPDDYDLYSYYIYESHIGWKGEYTSFKQVYTTTGSSLSGRFNFSISSSYTDVIYYVVLYSSDMTMSTITLYTKNTMEGSDNYYYVKLKSCEYGKIILNKNTQRGSNISYDVVCKDGYKLAGFLIDDEFIIGTDFKPVSDCTVTPYFIPENSSLFVAAYYESGRMGCIFDINNNPYTDVTSYAENVRDKYVLIKTFLLCFIQNI